MSASLENIRPDTPMGANLVDGGATFRTWAPHATAVHVVGDFNDFTPTADNALVVDDKGHWRGFIPGVTEGQRYKFWITGEDGPGYKRDPYAREVRGDQWHCIIRRAAFPWHDTGFAMPPLADVVLYQLHVGSFYAPHCPPRAGTFLDVILKVPYLADLGISVVQLLPIQEFPGQFSLGYNGTDYFAPESAFAIEEGDLAPYFGQINELLVGRGLRAYELSDLRGDTNQLKALVDVCHAYGLAVIFDLVFNHAGGGFGAESLWFYDRQRGAEEDPPRYWSSLFFSDQTWAGGNVFDFESTEVRRFLIDNARFFLEEYRVDGFRFDEVSVIDHCGYGHGWDFCQELTTALRALRPRILQHAEYWPVNPWVVKDTGEGGAGFDTTLTDGLRIALRNALAAAARLDGGPLPMTALAEQLAPRYLRDLWRGVQDIENHDLVLRPKDPGDHNRMERIARAADPSNPRSWWARSRSRVATGLVLTAPGIPMLFMGQEFMEDKQWSDDLLDYPGLLLYWQGLKEPDPAMRDFLRFARELLALRRELAGLRGGGFRLVHVHDANRVLAFHRWVPEQGHDVVVVVSLCNSHQYDYRVGLPGGGVWREAFNSDVYDHWPNPLVAGNAGRVTAEAAPLHGYAYSAPLTLPANALLVFAAAGA